MHISPPPPLKRKAKKAVSKKTLISVATLSAIAMLAGHAHGGQLSQDQIIELQNIVDLNDGATYEGPVKGTNDVTINIAKGKTVEFRESPDGNTFKGLTINGGAVKNAAHMEVDGNLILTGVQFENSKSFDIDLTAGHSAVLGEGTTLTNNGGFHADKIVLQTGSLYLEDGEEFSVVEGGLLLDFDHGTLEFAGGKLSDIESDGKKDVVKWALDGTAVIDVTGGEYTLKEVTVASELEAGKAAISVNGGNLTVDTFNLNKGELTQKTGTFKVNTFNAGGDVKMTAAKEGFTVGSFIGKSGTFTVATGNMKADAISLADGASLAVSEGAGLETNSGQVFTIGLGSDGSGVDAGKIKDGFLFDENSSLTLNDKNYNLAYSCEADKLLKEHTKSDMKFALTFTGNLVDADGNNRTEVSLLEVNEGVVHEQVTAVTSAKGSNTVAIDKDVGVQKLIVNEGHEVKVEAGKTLTLVGSTDGGELIKFDKPSEAQAPIVAVSGDKGGLTLGSVSKTTEGQLSAKLDLSNNATLTTQLGKFTLLDVKAADANIKVESGSLKVEKLELTGDSTIASKGETLVSDLTLGQGMTTITGAVTAEKLVAAANAAATLNVGSAANKGDLQITDKETSLKGVTFFLDPTWVDGQEVADASRLMISKTALDGTVVVGHNSYVVLGGTDDAAFKSLFEDGKLQWGDKGVLAAAYAAQPITIDSTGSLVVDGALTKMPSTGPVAGSVTFAANSVLVADVTNLSEGDAMITAEAFSIDETAKAVVVGTLKNGQAYDLTSEEGGFKMVIAGNAMWNLVLNEDGTFKANLTDAAVIYGNQMQGINLANAGMNTSNAYVNTLLEDESGEIPRSHIAATFDAAMHPGAAAAVYTTAYDRSSELREAVRKEAQGEGNRLWAQVKGGKVKLSGISTGAQDLTVDTTSHGLVVGGDAEVQNVKLGAAVMAGSGDSKNNAVGVKDEFTYYGLAAYGKTTVGSVDLLADASMTFVKSDIKMGGVADINTDTTTSVYSLGVQAQKTFSYAVEFTPFIAADLYHIRANGYGNGHGAHVADANATAVEFPMGATVSKAFDARGFTFNPSFTFAVVPTVGARDIDTKVTFAGAESTFNHTFTDDVKVRTNFGVTAQKANFRLGMNAGYAWGNEERSATSFMLNAQYLF